MKHKTIEIEIDYRRYGIVHSEYKPTITTYIKEQYPDYQDTFNRPLVVICPGGGFEHLSPREGEAIAVKMLDLGYNAVVLRYSLEPDRYPCQLFEAAYTVKYARDHAKEWDINPEKIIVAGFSAGGYVAAGIGTMWNDAVLDKFLKEELKCTHQYIKPDGMLLGYPVITSGEFAHRPSFERLLGADKYSRLVDYVSLENRVTKDTPKAFMWHTFEDASVPMENSLLFANALRKEGIPFEYHVFPKGCHGLGLGTKETASKNGKHFQPEVAVWPDLFAAWVKSNLD
ncbi:MAG: alpha/beta hydrolase [Eubacteriales bacterium]|nr:alpha/beta hydrolase [Eubacteriales bacterium]